MMDSFQFVVSKKLSKDYAEQNSETIEDMYIVYQKEWDLTVVIIQK